MAQAKRPKTYTTSPLEAIEDGVSQIEELGEEMREWFDNLPESLQGSERGERIEETADTLEASEARNRFDDFEREHSLLYEGKRARPGCPEHVPGTPCPVCRWDGQSRARPIPSLVEYDPPLPVEGWGDANTVLVAKVGNTRYVARGEDIEERRAYARRCWWEEAERTARWNEGFAIPQRRAPIEAVDSVDDYEELIDGLTVELHTSKRRPSRRNRLDDAIEALTQGVEAIKGAVEEQHEHDERFLAVLEALDDLQAVAEEVADLDFPGMYG